MINNPKKQTYTAIVVQPGIAYKDAGFSVCYVVVINDVADVLGDY